MTTAQDYTEPDLAEIADIVNKIVNPNKKYQARIRYAGSGGIFFYSDSTLQKEEQIKGTPDQPLSFGFLLGYLQDKLHKLGTTRNNSCHAEYCFCKYDTDIIKAHALFWELLDRLVDESVSAEQIEQMGMSYGLGVFQQFVESYVDRLILEEMAHQARICLEVLQPQQLFSETFLDECKKRRHQYTPIERAWQSNSLFRGTIQDVPLYVVDLHSCICGRETYVPKKAVHLEQSIYDPSPIYFGGAPSSIGVFYQEINNQEFMKVWKAIKYIFSKILPEGQAKVFGKLLAGISLTSTERNTKRQLRDKIRRTAKLIEVWDDLKELV